MLPAGRCPDTFRSSTRPTTLPPRRRRPPSSSHRRHIESTENQPRRRPSSRSSSRRSASTTTPRSSNVRSGRVTGMPSRYVLVLEKHADFLRDFRGDTIHPSTLEILDQIGLAERVLALPHTKAPTLRLRTPAGQF